MIRGWNGFGYYHDGFASGFPWMAAIFGVLLLAIAVALVALAIRFARRRDRLDAAGTGRALEILAERYARGEIDAEAFRAMKSELVGGQSRAKD